MIDWNFGRKQRCLKHVKRRRFGDVGDSVLYHSRPNITSHSRKLPKLALRLCLCAGDPTKTTSMGRKTLVNANDKAGPILKMTLPDLLQLWLVEQSNTFQSPQWLCRHHDPMTASSEH